MTSNNVAARRSGGEAVAAALSALGVTHVFGIVSVHNLPIYEALTRTEGITVVRCRHEQGAAHAADAFARTSGRLGVVLTSTGPGAVNAMAGLYEAQFGSSPLLMITGQIETRFYGKGKGFLHEAERQLDMLRTVTRRAESVRRTEDIAAPIIAVATDLLTGRPQPGAVEIPIDLQYRMADVVVPPVVAPLRAMAEPAALERAAALLNEAERPLIWAGGGVISADASAELERVATALGAPVITTIEGRGSLPEDHPLCLGPRVERVAMSPVIGEADVVLAVGTRFQNYATRVWQLQIPDQLIHIDADPAVIGRNYPAAVPIVADARAALGALAPLLRGGAVDGGYVDRARKSVQADLEQSREETGPDHWQIWQTMRRLLPPEAPIVRDSTVPAYLWGNRVLPVLRPRTSVRPSSLAIGPGVPLAVGAALGSGAPTVLIQGDGGLMLSLGELATMAEYRLPVVVCVFNDGGYGVLRQIQDGVMERRFGVDLHTPDFVKVADGMGIAAERVVGVGQFEPAFARAVERAGPTVLDIDMAALAPLNFPLPAHQQRRS
ncbi:MAG: thiamine pyrophosphate-binding protein [Acidimicrobiales bacterium]|nr:thiamine pyrophosphate-binding protein [Acidimicrobiales bacterium]